MRRLLDIPPVWFLGAAVLQGLLARIAPFTAIGLPQWLGWVLIAAGIAWAGSAALLFVRRRTPVEPRHDPRVLLADYHFRFNRNPIYTGMVAILFGWAIVLGALSAVLPALLFPVVIARRFVLDEERRLRAAFGARAEDYFRRTRRW